MDNKEASGGIAFYVMVAILVFLLVVCVILPLAIADFSKQPYALPLMGIGLALPFIHFFVFGGLAAFGKKK
ncbi:MAG: hypothetical protein LBD25_08965 [Coriobacteriales bacterium]|jgi:hypothetical protein|nr:hypothetical protein [Coriobacteriales bacterium]